MKHSLLLTLGLATVLAGCNQSDHTIVAGPDTNDDYNAAAAGNVVLPPSITSSKSYRCADNTIVKVEWLSDGKSANLRVGEAEAPTQVTAAEEGKPMTGPGGYSLEGTSGAGSVKIGLPGKSAQSCQG